MSKTFRSINQEKESKSSKTKRSTKLLCKKKLLKDYNKGLIE